MSWWWQLRRVTMEFDYQKAWKKIFGSNSEKVEVLDALRCFKCDTRSRYHMQIKTKRQEHDYTGSTNGKRSSYKYRAPLQGKGWLTCRIHRRQVLRSKAAKRHKAAKNANGSSS